MQIAEMVLGPAKEDLAAAAAAKKLPTPPIVEKAKALFSKVRKLVSPIAGEQKAALTVSGRVSLGPKKSLVLVEVNGQSILVAMSGDSTPALMAIPEAVSPESTEGKRRTTVRKGRMSC